MIEVLLAISGTDRNFIVLLFMLLVIAVYIVWQHRLLGKTKDLFRPADQAFMWETKMRLFENSVQAIIAIDENNKVVAWNNRAEEFFGWSEKEMLGKNMADHIIPVNYREMHKRGVESYVRTRKPSKLIDNKDGIELEALRKDGSTFSIRLYLAEFETKEGFLSFGAWIADITAEVKKRNELLESIKRLEETEERSGTGGYRYNIIDNTVKATKGLALLFGLKPEEITYDTLVSRIYFKDKLRVTNALVAAIEKNTGFTIEYRIFRTDGSLFNVRSVAEPVINDAGVMTELTGTLAYLNEVNDAT